MICKQCHNQIEDGSQFCLYCGSRQEPAQSWPAVPQYSPYTGKAAKSGRNKGVIIGIAAAALVLAVLLVGLVAGWFGAKGPVMTVANAAAKTLEGGNFTVEFRMDDDYDRIEGIAWVDIDVKQRTVNLLMELELDNEAGTLAIYDGYLILAGGGYYARTDISDGINAFFEAMEKTDSTASDWEELLEQMDPYLYEDINGYIDFDKLNGCIERYVKKLNNVSWMKENAGYRTENRNGTKFHILEPEMDKFLPASVACMEDAFIDPEDFANLMDEMDGLGELSDEIDIKTAFGIRGGKLTVLEAELDIEGDALTVEAEFSDIGKTELDPADLEDLLDRARDW